MSTSLSAPVIVFRNVHKVTIIKARFLLYPNEAAIQNPNIRAFACTVEKLYDFGLKPAKSRCERF